MVTSALTISENANALVSVDFAWWAASNEMLSLSLSLSLLTCLGRPSASWKAFPRLSRWRLMLQYCVGLCRSLLAATLHASCARDSMLLACAALLIIAALEGFLLLLLLLLACGSVRNKATERVGSTNSALHLAVSFCSQFAQSQDRTENLVVSRWRPPENGKEEAFQNCIIRDQPVGFSPSPRPPPPKSQSLASEKLLHGPSAVAGLTTQQHQSHRQVTGRAQQVSESIAAATPIGSRARFDVTIENARSRSRAMGRLRLR